MRMHQGDNVVAVARIAAEDLKRAGADINSDLNGDEKAAPEEQPPSE